MKDILTQIMDSFFFLSFSVCSLLNIVVFCVPQKYESRIGSKKNNIKKFLVITRKFLVITKKFLVITRNFP